MLLHHCFCRACRHNLIFPTSGPGQGSEDLVPWLVSQVCGVKFCPSWTRMSDIELMNLCNLLKCCKAEALSSAMRNLPALFGSSAYFQTLFFRLPRTSLQLWRHFLDWNHVSLLLFFLSDNMHSFQSRFKYFFLERVMGEASSVISAFQSG